jgi:hypothetical protein
MNKRCGILKYRLRPATIRCRSGTVANARRVEPPTRPVPPITSTRRLGTAADPSAPEVWQRTAPKHPIENTPVDISLSPSSLASARAHTHSISLLLRFELKHNCLWSPKITTRTKWFTGFQQSVNPAL